MPRGGSIARTPRCPCASQKSSGFRRDQASARRPADMYDRTLRPADAAIATVSAKDAGLLATPTGIEEGPTKNENSEEKAAMASTDVPNGRETHTIPRASDTTRDVSGLRGAEPLERAIARLTSALATASDETIGDLVTERAALRAELRALRE